MTYTSSIFAFVPFLVSLSVFFVAVYVFAQKRRSVLKRAFELFLLDMFVVTTADFLLRLSFSPEIMSFIYKAGVFFFSYSGVLYLNFMYAVTDTRRDSRLFGFAAIAAAGSSVAWFPFSNITLAPESGIPVVMPSPLSAAVLCVATLPAGIYGLALCVRHYRLSTNDRQRRIMRLLITGISISLVTGLIFMVGVPVFFPSLESLYRLNSLNVLIHLGYLYAAVSKYHFSSVNYDEIEQVSSSLFQHMSEAAVVFGAAGETVQANDAARRLFGATVTAAGIRARIPDYHTEETFSNLRVELLADRGGGRPETVHLSLSQSHIGVSGGPRCGKLLLVRDLTEEVRMQAEQRRLEIRLRQSEKMEAVGLLAGGVAHDFNNQLAGITGYADLLNEEVRENPRLLAFAQGILTAAKRAADVTAQLLAFARKGRYLSKAIDLNQMAAEVADILKHSIDKRIEIVTKPSDQPVVTEGDPSQIQSAILNLALNARDAMAHGGKLTLAVRRAVTVPPSDSSDNTTPPPGPYAVISVADTGTGISETVRARIFEPFFTTKPEGKGTGMGLAAVFGTVQGHGGAVRLQTEEGHGSVFSLYFPLSANESPPAEVAPSAVPQPVGNGRILLVDDEPVIRETASAMIERLGYTVEAADSGEAAVAYFAENSTDVCLVVLDLIMPSMSGEEVYGALVKLDPRVKVLISSGYSLNDMARRLLAQGAVGFIQKPFRMKDLSLRLSEILG